MLVAFLCTMFAANAAAPKVEGDLKCLKGQEAVATKFTYNNMTVGKMTEQAYVDKKVSEYNEKKAGRGDEWFAMWESDKEKVYPVTFSELFEKHSKIKTNNLEAQKYTLEVNTDFFEPGFNIGIVRQDAYVSVTVKVYETAAPDKVLAKVTILKAPGRTFSGNDYAISDRVGEAYAKAGKELAKVVAKAIK
ncbi:MAG: hypothetical protein MJZ28_02260 [Paludibacteraceae bacterium]|nr:hypothetical protein [Paludibacteraceae bacterium]